MCIGQGRLMICGKKRKEKKKRKKNRKSDRMDFLA